MSPITIKMMTLHVKDNHVHDHKLSPATNLNGDTIGNTITTQGRSGQAGSGGLMVSWSHGDLMKPKISRNLEITRHIRLSWRVSAFDMTEQFLMIDSRFQEELCDWLVLILL